MAEYKPAARTPENCRRHKMIYLFSSLSITVPGHVGSLQDWADNGEPLPCFQLCSEGKQTRMFHCQVCVQLTQHQHLRPEETQNNPKKKTKDAKLCHSFPFVLNFCGFRWLSFSQWLHLSVVPAISGSQLAVSKFGCRIPFLTQTCLFSATFLDFVPGTCLAMCHLSQERPSDTPWAKIWPQLSPSFPLENPSSKRTVR